jgi:uncharacterized protein YcgI (DUF1989 family)
VQRIDIPAGSAISINLARGKTCRVVNTRGGQVVDTWAFNADDYDEYLSMEHSRSAIYRLHFLPGDRLVSNRFRPVLRLRDDISPGFHDTLHAACSVGSNRFYGSARLTPNCEDNLVGEMARQGCRLVHVPCPWNLFEHALVTDDGVLRDQPSAAAAGDYIEFEALMDVLLVFSACPSLVHGISGDTPRGAGVDIL